MWDVSPIIKPMDLSNSGMFVKNSWEVVFGLGGLGPGAWSFWYLKITGRLGGRMIVISPNL